MKGKFQGQDVILINASVEDIWDILIDGEKLTSWMPVVMKTDSKVEHLGGVRHCSVEMNGKKGTVSEKCILFKQKDEIGWEMLSDEFGFDKMFENYGFSFKLTALSAHKTKVINRGFGTPKHLIAKMMNILIFKRMASKMRKRALGGIKILAEGS